MNSDHSPFSPQNRENIPQSPDFVLSTPEQNALKSPVVLAPATPESVTLSRTLEECVNQLKAILASFTPEGIEERLEQLISDLQEPGFSATKAIAALDELGNVLPEYHDLNGQIDLYKNEIMEWMTNQISPAVIQATRVALQTDHFVSYLKKHNVIGDDADIQYFYLNLTQHPEILDAYQTYMATSPVAQVKPRRSLFSPSSFAVTTPSPHAVQAIDFSNQKNIRNGVWLINNHGSNENTPVRKIFDHATQSWIQPPIPKKPSFEDRLRNGSHPAAERVYTAEELQELLLETLKNGPGKIFGATVYKYMHESRRDLLILAEKLKPFNPQLSKRILKFLAQNRQHNASEEQYKKNVGYFYLTLKFPENRWTIALKKFHDEYASFINELDPHGLASAFIEGIHAAKEKIKEQLNQHPHEALAEILTDELINLNILLKELDKEYEDGELFNNGQIFFLVHTFKYAHARATEQFNDTFNSILHNHPADPVTPSLSAQKERRITSLLASESSESAQEKSELSLPNTPIVLRRKNKSGELFENGINYSSKNGISPHAKGMGELLAEEKKSEPSFPKTQSDLSSPNTEIIKSLGNNSPECFENSLENSPPKGISVAAQRFGAILGRALVKALKKSEIKRPREDAQQAHPRFRVLQVLGDGECGYRGFGIERNHAHDILLANLQNPDVIHLLAPAIKEALLTDAAFREHLQNNYPNKLLADEFIQDVADDYSVDPDVARDFITYDILHRKINMGYVHPAVLQALAHIRQVGLRIWRLADDGVTYIPHQNGNAEDYGSYIPANAERIIDLLFVNGNHFNVLEAIENDLDEQPPQAARGEKKLKSSPGFFSNAIDRAIKVKTRFKEIFEAVMERVFSAGDALASKSMIDKAALKQFAAQQIAFLNDLLEQVPEERIMCHDISEFRNRIQTAIIEPNEITIKGLMEFIKEIQKTTLSAK